MFKISKSEKTKKTYDLSIPLKAEHFRVYCIYCKKFIGYKFADGVDVVDFDISHGAHKTCGAIYLAEQLASYNPAHA